MERIAQANMEMMAEARRAIDEDNSERGPPRGVAKVQWWRPL
jgi:hypothetical protein